MAGVTDPGSAQEPLVGALRALEDDAWTALYDAHHARLWRYAYARTGSRDLADDVVAQVFAEALTSIQRYRPAGKPILAWLYIIARNHASKALRDARRRVPMVADVAVHPLDDRLESLVLGQALRSLPASQRELLTLRYVVEASTEEICRLLGKSPAAVYSLQARAIEAVGRKLQPREKESASAATNPAPAGYRHVR